MTSELAWVNEQEGENDLFWAPFNGGNKDSKQDNCLRGDGWMWLEGMEGC